MKIDMQQFSASVADFDFFFMIFSVLYENVYTGSNCTFSMLESHKYKIRNSFLPA